MKPTIPTAFAVKSLLSVLVIVMMTAVVVAQESQDVPAHDTLDLTIQEEVTPASMQEVLDQLPLMNQRLQEEERRLPGPVATFFGDDTISLAVTEGDTVTGLVVIIADGIITELAALEGSSVTPSIEIELSSDAFDAFFAAEEKEALLTTMIQDETITIRGTSFGSRLKVSLFKISVGVASWFV